MARPCAMSMMSTDWRGVGGDGEDECKAAEYLKQLVCNNELKTSLYEEYKEQQASSCTNTLMRLQRWHRRCVHYYR